MSLGRALHGDHGGQNSRSHPLVPPQISAGDQALVPKRRTRQSALTEGVGGSHFTSSQRQETRMLSAFFFGLSPGGCGFEVHHQAVELEAPLSLNCSHLFLWTLPGVKAVYSLQRLGGDAFSRAGLRGSAHRQDRVRAGPRGAGWGHWNVLSPRRRSGRHLQVQVYRHSVLQLGSRVHCKMHVLWQ